MGWAGGRRASERRGERQSAAGQIGAAWDALVAARSLAPPARPNRPHPPTHTHFQSSPFFPPSSLSLVSSVAGLMRTPSMATGSPFSNSICSREGAARAHVGAARASWAWERPGRSSCAHTSKQGGSFTHLDVGGLVGRLLGRHRPCEHRLRGLHPWVFQRIAAQREGRGVSSLEGCAGGQGAGEGGSLRGAWFLGSCSPSAGRSPPPRLLSACTRPR